MAKILIDGVSDEFKKRLKNLAKKRGVSYKKIVMDSIERVEGLRDE